MVFAVVTLAALAVAIVVPALVHERGSAAVPGWRSMVNPGALSGKHHFLAADCGACHVPHRGPSADKCIACHAANESLLSRQPTAFHADAAECRGCHVEHLGVAVRPTTMDHVALARMGAREWPLPTDLDLRSLRVEHGRIRPEEAALDCSACHANQDRHRTLFGRECAACHATDAWSIAEFRHPSPLSTECAQCHQAPRSHFMEHFRAVSMKVSGVEHADVSQCFLCHETNAWNDIKGVGWYEHH